MKGEHLTDGVLISAIDDELDPVEGQRVAAHIAICEACAGRHGSLRHLSQRIESAVMDIPVAVASEGRDHLEHELERREAAVVTQRSSPVWRRLSWAMAVAAAIGFALMFVPQWKRTPKIGGGTAAVQPSTFELDGERFLALPYSDPELPVNTAHVVEMQVPVSTLADAGIVFEPISNEIASADRSVKADVLLGLDGRPMGIHVLTNE